MKQYDFFYYENGAPQTGGSSGPISNNYIRLNGKDIWDAIDKFKKLYELAPNTPMDMTVTQICELQ